MVFKFKKNKNEVLLASLKSFTNLKKIRRFRISVPAFLLFLWLIFSSVYVIAGFRNIFHYHRRFSKKLLETCMAIWNPEETSWFQRVFRSCKCFMEASKNQFLIFSKKDSKNVKPATLMQKSISWHNPFKAQRHLEEILWSWKVQMLYYPTQNENLLENICVSNNWCLAHYRIIE